MILPETNTIKTSSNSISHLGKYPKFLKLKPVLISVENLKKSDIKFLLVLIFNFFYLKGKCIKKSYFKKLFKHLLILSISSIDKLEPEGRHNPCPNNFSATFPP